MKKPDILKQVLDGEITVQELLDKGQKAGKLKNNPKLKQFGYSTMTQQDPKQSYPAWVTSYLFIVGAFTTGWLIYQYFTQVDSYNMTFGAGLWFVVEIFLLYFYFIADITVIAIALDFWNLFSGWATTFAGYLTTIWPNVWTNISEMPNFIWQCIKYLPETAYYFIDIWYTMFSGGLTLIVNVLVALPTFLSTIFNPFEEIFDFEGKPSIFDFIGEVLSALPEYINTFSITSYFSFVFDTLSNFFTDLLPLFPTYVWTSIT
jgi:hypothetical protein